MKNLILIALISSILLLTSNLFAVSADRGNFVKLGRADESEEGAMLQEGIVLYMGPGVDSKQAELKSGALVQVLQVVKVNNINYYNVSTIGQGGGIIGWVAEDCIYEIVTEPPLE